MWISKCFIEFHVGRVIADFSAGITEAFQSTLEPISEFTLRTSEVFQTNSILYLILPSREEGMGVGFLKRRNRKRYRFCAICHSDTQSPIDSARSCPEFPVNARPSPLLRSPPQGDAGKEEVPSHASLGPIQ